MITSDGIDVADGRKKANAYDESLKELLQFFGAASLGDGNVNAGANTLAAMALTLANLTHPDSRGIGGTSQSVSLGCSFLATGSLTPALVNDCVVGPVAATQRNLNQRMEEHERVLGLRAKYIAAGDNMRSEMDPNKERKRVTQSTLVEEVVNGTSIALESKFSVEELIGCSADHLDKDKLHDFLVRHTYFISGESPEILLKHLKNVHLDRPLACFTVQGIGSVADYSQLVKNVLDGYCRGNSMAKGHLIVCDPEGCVSDSGVDSKIRSSWLKRMLWLVDGTETPGFDSYCHLMAKCEISGRSAFSVSGLRSVLSSRLLEEGGGRAHFAGIAGLSGYFLNIGDSQAKWCKILLQREAVFPGITHALRSMPASLIAGFGAMGFRSRWGLLGLVRASYRFSMILMERMLSAYKHLGQTEDRNRHESLETRVIGSLERNGPSKAYTISKNLNGVATIECKQALTSLESRGVVQRGNDKFWYLADSGVVARN